MPYPDFGDNDDHLTEEQRLVKYTGPVSYDYLVPYLRKGILVVVHEALDLTRVGLAFVHDDKRSVQAWLDEELLVRASEETFEKREGRHAYTVLIVAPFVLCRIGPIPHGQR
jgi:hypothetical protein